MFFRRAPLTGHPSANYSYTMKRMHCFWTLLAAVLSLSCGPKNNPEGGETSLSVTPSSLIFEMEDASSKIVTVTTSAPWTAVTRDSWLHLSSASGEGNGSFSVKVDPLSGSPREAVITVSAGDKTATVSVKQGADGLVPMPASFDGTKRSNTAYQLLIYSFADSDGDGWGDIKGIIQRLDYLDELGVTALWLSPMHPSDSYHGYDVTDYFAVHPKLGTEDDFKELLEKAHAKGIEIYLDYVLNHSGKGHAWFKDAISNPDSPYRDYYFFSANPSSDYRNFPMLTGTTYQQGEWKQVTSGSPKLTITATTEAVTNGTASWNLWTWQEGGEGKFVQFVDKGDGTYYMVLDISGKWGMLVRKYNHWNAGSKFGAKTGGTITVGQPVDLVGDGADMWFTGSGRYKIELTDVSTETLFYMGCFSDWMPDLNYGDVSVAQDNACFKDMAASADKWIKMGVDGLRLDAVKHICGGIGSYNANSNRTLLAKWYEHCNATYKENGGTGNFFMVAEEWDSHDIEKTYYKSLTSCFEFDYGYKLRDMLNSGNASGFVSAVSGFVSDHTAQRSDAITSFFLSNHDQNRFASEIGKNVAREKQAAAILLSGPGKPFIYQGEELGYWGKKDSGDEYVRTPIKWTKTGAIASGALNGKIDNSMLTADISVEAQKGKEDSILNVYKTWSRLRNTYPALAGGTMTAASVSGTSIAAWYMSMPGAKSLLVIHNVASSTKNATVTDSMATPVAVLGVASVSGKTLTLGPNSSVVFEL